MKLFYFLLTFVLVNVLTDELNALFEVAYSMNNCTIENNFIANGLEHFIKKIVFQDKYFYDFMNLHYMNYMIVSPEYPSQDNIQEFTELHETLNNEIIAELKIAVPVNPSENYKNLDFTQLGNERRRLTGKALRNLICRTIDSENLTKLIEERRYAPSNKSRNKIVHASDRNMYRVPIKKLCQFIALFFSTKCPTQELFSSINEDTNTCKVTNTRSIPEKHVYREIDGIWYQVSINDKNNPIETLKKQMC